MSTTNTGDAKKAPQNTPKKPRARKRPSSKVIDKKVETPKQQPRRRPTRLFPAIVNGVERQITKLTFRALIRDQDNFIELPEGSELRAVAPKDCKNCG